MYHFYLQNFPAILLVACSLLLQLSDYLYHRIDNASLKLDNGEQPLEEFHAIFRKLPLQSKRWDNFFGVFPFLWTYCLIFAAILLSNNIHSWIIQFSLILFVTGRIRTLQEIGHYAMHYILCANGQWGLLLTNIFYQFPWGMEGANIRRHSHVHVHHRSIQRSEDPDFDELIDKNVKPGIGNKKKFWLILIYPFTRRGIRDRCVEVYHEVKNDYGKKIFYLRILLMLCLPLIIFFTGSFSAVLLFYIVPFFLTYPLFYWLAHLALHRWFASCPEGIEYYQRELILGRPTEFKGLIGFIVRHNIMPLGDSYHLAHSLFPTIRWNHLSKVDKLLKLHCKAYLKYQSCNLIFPSKDYPSALSELEKRLVSESVNAS